MSQSPRGLEIDELQSWLGRPLPSSYREFLEGSGALEKEGVYLYAARDVPRMNKLFDVRKYSGSALNIGDDGGGFAFVILLDHLVPVYQVGHGSMHPDDFALVNTSFAAWMKAGFPAADAGDDDRENWERPVDIYLETMPRGGAADLALIRRILTPGLALSRLLEVARNPPAAVLEKVPYGEYRERVLEINRSCGECLRVRESKT